MSFNKNYEDWKGVAKSPLAKSSTGSGEIVNKPVAKSPLTKETTKETIQKKLLQKEILRILKKP